MTTSNLIRTLALGAALALLPALVAPPALQASDDLAMASDGTLYRALVGEHGELFGGTASERVLALEIETADGAERLLVPGTDSWRPEVSPRVVYDASADAAILIWRTATASGTYSVFFTSYRDGAWTGVNQMRDGGDVVFLESPPSIVTTRDRFELQLTEETSVTVSGVAFHVVWREQGHARYSPILFVDGEQVGWSETLSLSAVLQQAHQAQEPGAGGPSLDAELFQVGPAEDGRRLLVTFTEATYGRIGTLAVGVLPLDLSFLGDALQQRILDHADIYDPGDLEPFAGKIRGEIISTGHKSNSNPALTHYLATDLAAWILDAGLEYGWDLQSLAAAARGRAVHVGSAVYATTTVDPHDPDAQVLQIDLGDLLDEGGARDELIASLDLDLRSDYAPPASGLEGASVHTSPEGCHLAVARATEDRLEWTVNRGDGWSETRSLTLGGAIDQDKAFELLHESLR